MDNNPFFSVDLGLFWNMQNCANTLNLGKQNEWKDLKMDFISTSEWCIIMLHKHVTLTFSALQGNILFCFQFTSHPLNCCSVFHYCNLQCNNRIIESHEKGPANLICSTKIPSMCRSFLFSFANFCHVLNFSHFSHTLETSILPSPPTGFKVLQEVTKACWTYHILRRM